LALVLIALLGICARPAISSAGSKAQKERVWVKRPDAGSHIELVSSLALVCDEHDLEEAAMRAVSAGEVDDHRGWKCGTIGDYPCNDAQQIEEAATQEVVAATENIPAEDVVVSKEKASEDATEDTDATSGPQTPPMNKLIIQLGSSALATQLLKQMEKRYTDVVPLLRLAYYAVVAVRLLVHALISWRISVRADSTKLEKPAAADPLSALLGGLRAPQNEQAPTVAEYDKKQLQSLSTSYQVGAIFVFLLHVFFKWKKTLILSAVSSLVDIFFHPLFQIHLLQRPAAGPLKRPFGSDGPNMAALFKQATAGAAAPPPVVR